MRMRASCAKKYKQERKTYGEESVDEVCLDGGQSFVLDQNGVGLIPLCAHEGAEPRLLSELRRRLRREVHLICRDCGAALVLLGHTHTHTHTNTHTHTLNKWNDPKTNIK